MKKTYTNIKINNLPLREVEIEGEITLETMLEMRNKSLAKIKETAEADGFRKGNVPENIIVQKVGEVQILEDAAEMALNLAYPDILDEHKIDAIGRPEITITKIAPNNPLSFKIKTSLAPEVKLPDYKKLVEKITSKKPETIEVTESEIDTVILDVRKNVAHAKMHEHDAPGEPHLEHPDIKEEDLPEVDEQFLKQIGGFPTVEDLRAKIKENMLREKEGKAKDKKRTDMIEAIIADSTIEIPQVIIDAELEKMSAQFKDDIARAGIDFTEYLTHIKKTEDDLKKDWHDTAVKRAQSQIVLNTIAREENITPKEEDIKKEMESILSHDKNLERFRVRMFVETFLTNELVFQFLEK
jgi:trigger factor